MVLENNSKFKPPSTTSALPTEAGSIKTPATANTKPVEQAYVGIYYTTIKHSLRAALQLSPPDMQRSVTLNYSYLPVLVKLSN